MRALTDIQIWKKLPAGDGRRSAVALRDAQWRPVVSRSRRAVFRRRRRVRGAVLTFTNITAFRASLGQAVYEREYTKTILNAVIDPLVVLDDRMQVQTANRAFYDWFGVSREQSHGTPLRNSGR